MANNKVQLSDGTVLLDLTGDTVTPDTLLEGFTAHGKDGAPIVGTLTVPTASIKVAGLSQSDTVTAAMGGKTKTAKWVTDGRYWLIDGIRDFGTWTVTATNGTKTATQDVLVDVITEYEITMAYRLYLYNEGDECEDVTGGWERVENGYAFANAVLSQHGTDNLFIKMTDCVGLRSYSVYSTLIRPRNQIDFSPYSRLCITVKEIEESGNNSPLVFITNNTVLSSEQSAGNFYFAPQNQAVGIYETIFADLSITDSRYLFLLAYSSRSFDIKKIWLE